MPSILSNTPPWPGNKSLVSFTLALRFKKEINKSPNWDIQERAKVTKNKDAIILSKAPINKNEAMKETKAKVISENNATMERERAAKTNPNAAKATRTFTSKLYQDDDEFNELKVLGGLDEDDDEVLAAR